MAYLRFSSKPDDRFYIYMSMAGLRWIGPDEFFLKSEDKNDLRTAKKMREALDDFISSAQE